MSRSSGRAESATGALPLARLLAIAYRGLVEELHTELDRRGWSDIRPAYGFALLSVRDAPATVTELAAALGMTKQAASKLVDAMSSGGYVQRTLGTEDARTRAVELTARGAQLLQTVEEIYVDLEAGWAEVIGKEQLERLRRNLVEVTSAETGRLPPVRPVW